MQNDKARLDGALINLVWWVESLLKAGELEPDDPFQHKPLHDSTKSVLFVYFYAFED